MYAFNQEEACFSTEFTLSEGAGFFDLRVTAAGNPIHPVDSAPVFYLML
jgi:hypothetical protein